jgi:hypothetical protein
MPPQHPSRISSLSRLSWRYALHPRDHLCSLTVTDISRWMCRSNKLRYRNPYSERTAFPVDFHLPLHPHHTKPMIQRHHTKEMRKSSCHWLCPLPLTTGADIFLTSGLSSSLLYCPAEQIRSILWISDPLSRSRLLILIHLQSHELLSPVPRVLEHGSSESWTPSAYLWITVAPVVVTLFPHLVVSVPEAQSLDLVD